MMINDRKVTFVPYQTNGNWDATLPKEEWLCLLIVNEVQRNYFDEVVSKIIDNDVAYICTSGKQCELAHDLIDEEITFREVDDESHYLPPYLIMTTWHPDLEEGIWFAFNSAYHPDVDIKEIVIIDLAHGLEAKQIKAMLD